MDGGSLDDGGLAGGDGAGGDGEFASRDGFAEVKADVGGVAGVVERNGGSNFDFDGEKEVVEGASGFHGDSGFSREDDQVDESYNFGDTEEADGLASPKSTGCYDDGPIRSEGWMGNEYDVEVRDISPGESANHKEWMFAMKNDVSPYR